MGKHVKTENYSESAIRGKKILLLGAMPVILFMIMAGMTAFVIANFTNKMTVNKNPDVCNAVRRQYPNNIQSTWSCDLADKGDYFLVTFNQSANTGTVAALMSFKYEKSTKAITPAISIE